MASSTLSSKIVTFIVKIHLLKIQTLAVVVQYYSKVTRVNLSGNKLVLHKRTFCTDVICLFKICITTLKWKQVVESFNRNSSTSGISCRSPLEQHNEFYCNRFNEKFHYNEEIHLQEHGGRVVLRFCESINPV
jgi:hypothetical protein